MVDALRFYLSLKMKLQRFYMAVSVPSLGEEYGCLALGSDLVCDSLI